MEYLYLSVAPLPPCDIELFEHWVPGSLPLSTTAVT